MLNYCFNNKKTTSNDGNDRMQLKLHDQYDNLN